ncbi:MAG: hypothetical protein ACN4E2_07325, partial [Nitrospinota bacterium]
MNSMIMEKREASILTLASVLFLFFVSCSGYLDQEKESTVGTTVNIELSDHLTEAANLRALIGSENLSSMELSVFNQNYELLESIEIDDEAEEITLSLPIGSDYKFIFRALDGSTLYTGRTDQSVVADLENIVTIDVDVNSDPSFDRIEVYSYHPSDVALSIDAIFSDESGNDPVVVWSGNPNTIGSLQLTSGPSPIMARAFDENGGITQFNGSFEWDVDSTGNMTTSSTSESGDNIQVQLANSEIS